MDFANLHDLKKVRKSDNIQGICEQTEHVPRGPLFVARAAEISHFFNLARLRDSVKIFRITFLAIFSNFCPLPIKFGQIT